MRICDIRGNRGQGGGGSSRCHALYLEIRCGLSADGRRPQRCSPALGVPPNHGRFVQRKLRDLCGSQAGIQHVAGGSFPIEIGVRAPRSQTVVVGNYPRTTGGNEVLSRSEERRGGKEGKQRGATGG